MPDLSLDQLVDHPERAGDLPDAKRRALVANIRETGRCPALIVRRLRRNRYQIIDGHQRAAVLRELGHHAAPCEIWRVDDDETRLLLLTLNQLRGRDDPVKRGRLLRALGADRDAASFARRLPETTSKIDKLIGLTTAPPRPAPPPRPRDLPHPLTFFVTSAQRSRVVKALNVLDRDRTLALMAALGVAMDEANTSGPGDRS